MNLLVINFEMDPRSQVLSWQLRVVQELAVRCARVTVLTHRAAADLHVPRNVRVIRFPLLPQRAPFRWLGGRVWLGAWVWGICRRERIDACFIHMNMEWAYRLFPAFAVLRLPVLLWYAHGTVSTRLRLAHAAVTRVVTSTPEGFRIPSTKVRVIGQGIDTDVFRIHVGEGDLRTILSVGRISRRKRLDLLVEVMAELTRRRPDLPFTLSIVGAPVTADDRQYEQELRALVRALGVTERVDFLGFRQPAETADLYRNAFLHLNVSQTGSMDKTVMEALSCGCPVLTTNEAFRGAFANSRELLLDDDSPGFIAGRVLRAYDQRNQIDRNALRAQVVGRHDLAGYVDRLRAELDDLSGPVGRRAGGSAQREPKGGAR